MDSNFWAAITGAILGGAIAIGGQFISFSTQNYRDQKSTATELFFKVLRIHTDLYNVKVYLDEGFARARAHGLPPSEAIMRIVNRIAPVSITPQDFGLALTLGDDGLLNSLVSLQQKHELLMHSLDRYNELRAELDTYVVGGVPTKGGLTDVAIDRQTAPTFFNRIGVADNLLSDWRDQTLRDYLEADHLVGLLRLHLRSRFGVRLGMRRNPRH